jgi:TPR repeat protein
MAQHDLGVMLLNGLLGVQQDRAAGIGWLKLSAQGGFEYAERKLRLHLSAWEYFREMTWPAYREAFQQGGLNARLVVNLLIDMTRAAFA